MRRAKVPWKLKKLKVIEGDVSLGEGPFDQDLGANDTEFTIQLGK
jgi:hypothetical protein